MAPAECGLTGPCVAWVESDPGVGPSMATAADLALILALEKAAQEEGVKIASVRPIWASATERAGRKFAGNALLACRDEDALTLLAWVSAQASFAASYVPAPARDDQALLLQRMQVSNGIEAEAVHRAQLTAQAGAPPSVVWAP
jgi:hypothetical protein